MYSESDLEHAVDTGAITAETAAAFRASVAAARSAPRVDEESFRLLTGFNDIFVTIAAILLLAALGWIGSAIGGGLVPPPPGPLVGPAFQADVGTRAAHSGAIAALLVAAASWALAEYFTRIRRMALPSIVLLAAFAAAAGAFVAALCTWVGGGVSFGDTAGQELQVALAALAVALAAAAHWRRFHVPITIAVLTGAGVATAIAALAIFVPFLHDALLLLVLAGGLATFAFAMWWDMSDPQRLTRRADVAFWLHLAAAPMIAHPIFNLLGVFGSTLTASRALVVLILYLAFGLVALAVDRRALLVSSLVYVLYAMNSLLGGAGAIGLNFALTGLIIGGALLLLSAWWHPIRRMLVSALPDELQHHLPPAGELAVGRVARV